MKKKPTSLISLINDHEIKRLIQKSNLSTTEIDEFLDHVNTEVELQVKELLKSAKNKSRIKANDDAKAHVKATEVLSAEDIEKLPKWVKDQIAEAQIVGTSGDVVQVADGRKYHRKNRLNDLSGGAWTFFLNSVVNTRFPTSGPESYAHSIRKIHPSPKPPQLMKEIIEFFTKENEIVLDYFMGVGGTLLGASLCNRKAIGVDLSQEFIDAYKEANKSLGLEEQKTVKADSIKLLEEGIQLESFLGDSKVSLILIDPPYGDMLSRAKTGEAIKKKEDNSPTPFTDLSTDLGNMSIEEFFPVFKQSIKNAMKYLKPKGHIAIFMKDLQPTKENPNLLHARVIEDLASIENLNYLGLKIWADQGVNLYPYGYPYSFVSNQIHQYIMFFRMD